MGHRVLALLLCCVVCIICYSSCMSYNYEFDEGSQVDEFIPRQHIDQAAIARLLATKPKAKPKEEYGADPLTLSEWKPAAKQLLLDLQQEQMMEKLRMEHIHTLSLAEQIERILPEDGTNMDLYDLIVHLPKFLKPEVINKPTFTQEILNILTELQQHDLIKQLEASIARTKELTDSTTCNCLTSDVTHIAHIYEPFTPYFANTRSGAQVIGFGELCSNTRIFNDYYQNSNCDGISTPVTEAEALRWQFRDLHAAFDQCFANKLINKKWNNNQYSALASLASSVDCQNNKFNNLIQSINDGNVLSTVCQIQLLQHVPKRGITEAKLFMSHENRPCLSEKPLFIPSPDTNTMPEDTVPNVGSSKEVVLPGSNENSNIPLPVSRPATPLPHPRSIPTHNTRREVPNNLRPFQQSNVVTREPTEQPKGDQLGLSLTGLLVLIIGAAIFVALTIFACLKLRRYRKLLEAKRTNESLQRLSTADQTTVASYGYVL